MQSRRVEATTPGRIHRPNGGRETQETQAHAATARESSDRFDPTNTGPSKGIVPPIRPDQGKRAHTRPQGNRPTDSTRRTRPSKGIVSPIQPDKVVQHPRQRKGIVYPIRPDEGDQRGDHEGTAQAASALTQQHKRARKGIVQPIRPDGNARKGIVLPIQPDLEVQHPSTN